MITTPRNPFWPDVSKEVGPTTKFALKIAQDALQNHDDAFRQVKMQIDDLRNTVQNHNVQHNTAISQVQGQVSTMQTTVNSLKPGTAAAMAPLLHRIEELEKHVEELEKKNPVAGPHRDQEEAKSNPKRSLKRILPKKKRRSK